jgi:hypothetical protein
LLPQARTGEDVELLAALLLFEEATARLAIARPTTKKTVAPSTPTNPMSGFPRVAVALVSAQQVDRSALLSIEFSIPAPHVRPTLDAQMHEPVLALHRGLVNAEALKLIPLSVLSRCASFIDLSARGGRNSSKPSSRLMNAAESLRLQGSLRGRSTSGKRALHRAQVARRKVAELASLAT